MNITGLLFLCIFLPIILIVYYNPIFIRQEKALCSVTGLRNLILLEAGLLLYSIAQPLYIPLLVVSTLLNYLLSRLMYHYRSKVPGYVAIILDVAVLLLFKYINLPIFGITAAIPFPIGLSYFTFREISYISDMMNHLSDDVHPETFNIISFRNTSLYITDFITLFAGPLGEYDNEIKQIHSRYVKTTDLYEGVMRIATGFIKKVLIADSLKQFVDLCFSMSSVSVVTAWAASICYSLELYFDFSGYTDIALGVGRLFGFKFNENFNHPYTASSICDFWKRWHMSLTSWFTKYVYFPLGGSRVNTAGRHIFNLLVVWLCTGIWHGSRMNFIIWALIYFVFQVLEKYTGLSERIKKVHLGHLYTLLIVNINWVIFRAESPLQAASLIGNMFGMTASGLMNPTELSALSFYMVPISAAVFLSTGLQDKLIQWMDSSNSLYVLKNLTILILFISAMVVAISRGHIAPLYGGF